jgi:hypothetical protein
MLKTYHFLLLLLSALLVAFGIHLGILFLMESALFSDRIVLSYAVNFLLAAVVYLIIQQTFKKNSSQAGFIFMAGSGLKFLVFFILFYPSYQEDGSMQTTEFTAFFAPYALCLLIEVFYLSKQLNNQTYSEENQEDSLPKDS